MNQFFALLSLLAISGVSQGNTWSKNESHSAYPGKCYYKEMVHDPGEVPRTTACFRLICSPNGWISGHNCINASIEGCERGRQIDSKRPFPECCKRTYTCHHGNGTKYTIEDY